MAHVEEVIRETFPGIYVTAIMMGDGKLDSVFWNMNYQVETSNHFMIYLF